MTNEPVRHLRTREPSRLCLQHSPLGYVCCLLDGHTTGHLALAAGEVCEQWDTTPNATIYQLRSDTA